MKKGRSMLRPFFLKGCPSAALHDQSRLIKQSDGASGIVERPTFLAQEKQARQAQAIRKSMHPQTMQPLMNQRVPTINAWKEQGADGAIPFIPSLDKTSRCDAFESNDCL